jgi:hypothetical protein
MPAIFLRRNGNFQPSSSPLGSQHFAFSVLTSVAELVGPSQFPDDSRRRGFRIWPNSSHRKLNSLLQNR